MAIANNNTNKKVVAIIGDGAMTAGMAFEGLAHAGHIKPDMLIILNDNDMSISENVGGLNNYFSRIWASKVYKGIRKSGKSFLENLPQAHHIARKVETQMKAMVAPGSIFGSNGELIATSPYYKVNVKITFIVLACTICFNLVAIPSFGVAGVAYSNVLTLLLLNIMRSGYLYRMCKISPFNKDLLSVVFTGTFIIFISIVMPFEGLYRFIFSMIIVFLALARLKKYFHHML